MLTPPPRSAEQGVDLIAKGETLSCHRKILTDNSEYFERCLRKPWEEAHRGAITFDNVEPCYLALFVGVAYAHCSLVPVQPPTVADNPQCKKDRTPMRDLVEVWKLCDRFVAAKMGHFVQRCLGVAIADGHRAMFRAHTDENLHKALTRDFADGYEALEMNLPAQKALSEKMIEYFAGSINYDFWATSMADVQKDRPRFVTAVGRSFSTKLGELIKGRKHRRREMLAIKWEEES